MAFFYWNSSIGSNNNPGVVDRSIPLFFQDGTLFDDSNYNLFINSGKFGHAYKNSKDNSVLKLYSDCCPVLAKMDLDLFMKLKSCSIPNLVPLYDCLFYSSDFSQIEGYTMEYINDDKSLILELCSSDFLHFIYELGKMVKVASENNILLRDVHPDNICFNSNGFTLIDLDNFLLSFSRNRNIIYEKNKQSIIYCINMIFSSLVDEKKYIDFINGDIATSLYRCVLESLTEPSLCDSLQKKLVINKSTRL